MDTLDQVSATAYGLQAVLARELKELDYEQAAVEDGRVRFRADAAAICRTNLWLRCAERVQVVVGEFAGMYLIDEWRHFKAFTEVRDSSLKAAGRLIPCGATMYMSAIDSRQVYLERGFGLWEAPLYGFDFSHVGKLTLEKPRREIIQAEQNSIVATKPLASFDFARDDASAFLIDRDVEFVYPASGSCHGFVGDPPTLKWSDSRYGFWPEEDRKWHARDTSPKRSSRSCGRLMC
jgi:hypothetical protein